MTAVQISLVSLFWDLIAQICPMTLTVCVSILIFFLISTRKSLIYTLLYISATLNERIFSGSGLWMKKTNLCSCNNSFGIYNISFLHHRHLHASARVINIYIWDCSLTLRLFTWINRFVRRKTSFRILCVFLADFKAISAVVFSYICKV